MTIQELFRKANKQMVFNAYTLIEPLFDDLDTDSLAIKASKMEIIKNRIFSLCEHISECELVQEDNLTVFVMEKSSEEYGCSYIKEIEVFGVKDDEAIENVNKNFTICNDNGEVSFKCYDISSTSFNEAAAFSIAEESVNTYGIDVCCAAILRKMCLWGTSIEDREKRINEVTEELENREKNFNSEECISAEEAFARIKEEIFSDLSEDEKLYHQHKKEFEEKVREIELRRISKITDENHKKYMDTIRIEYKTRIRNNLIRKSIKFFHDNEDRLIEEYGPHKFLLIYDGEVKGVFDSYNEGLEVGCKKYMLGSFAIQETAAEPIYINLPEYVSKKNFYDDSAKGMISNKVKNKVFHLSKEQIDRYKIMSFDKCADYCNRPHPKTSVIISIVTYEGDLKEKIRITENNNVKDILYLKFCDFDISYNPSQCMQDSDAKKIVSFVNKWYDNVDTIIVHCEGGISRSAGVCAAIMRVKEGTDYPVFRSKSKRPNMTCYLKTLKAFDYI